MGKSDDSHQSPDTLNTGSLDRDLKVWPPVCDLWWRISYILFDTNNKNLLENSDMGTEKHLVYVLDIVQCSLSLIKALHDI